LPRTTRVRAALALAALVAAGAWLAAHAAAPKGEGPPGMVAFPAGTAHVGSKTGEPIERPELDVDVASFYLDVHPVTVAEFQRFADATGYRTQAETHGSSGVFDPSTGTWSLVDGTDWRHPRGPDAPPAAGDHPVTQVSWNDATAYCKWAGKRLPTEFEWERAARSGAKRDSPYAWGDALVVGGKYMANTWQGHFPARNTVEDGYLFTSPVGAFGATSSGLTDMGGNVWQWCDDWFRPYSEREKPFTPRPDSQKVMRGGSFLCDPNVCHGFRVSARGHTTPETSLMHIGFRCAKSVAG
jgi:sulfatase modifying factor 1